MRPGLNERQEDGIWTSLKEKLSLSMWFTDFGAFSFCRILTDVGGMCEGKKKEKEKNNKKKNKMSKMCNRSCFDLITCTLIIVYYDDGMTECTEDDWQLSPEC